MEDYGRALEIARDNYNRFSSNPFMIQAFFNCLVQQPRTEEIRKEIEGLIALLESLATETSLEMAASAKAQFIAVYEGNELRAFQVIDDAILAYPNNDYPTLTKMDIAV
jgi:hypothetical protein